MKKISSGFCLAIFLQNYCFATDAEEDIEELKKCPCVQKYVLEVYREDLAAMQPKKTKKKKKKIVSSVSSRKTEKEPDNDEQDKDNHENEEDNNGDQQAAE